MKTALIDVGGGMRGIYAAGVLDCCLDEQVTFEAGIGISAGSANIASFLAHQRGRNKRYFLEYSFRKEYMSLSNYRTKGSFLNLDYIYGTLSNSDGEYPLDYQAIIDNPTILYVLACNAWTGETKIFYKSDLSLDNYDIFKASCAIPSICKPYFIDGIPYFDGALGDTISLDMVENYDRIVLILTKPSRKDDLLARRIEKQYPKAAEQLHLRAVKYNAGVAKAKDLEKTGKLLIIAPENTEGVDTLTRDKGAFLRLYTRGYMDGHQVKEFINRHAL